MEKQIKYKLQGDGSDSWDISEYEGDELITRYMVYEDPTVLPVPKVDVVGLLNSLSAEELSQVKQILNS